ncbi:butyrophilin-like protein 2 [Labeo rohita]|uniref:butyrophilin-like protein 2 n=1 Tax=Labeo rohita TaxID=84645 RepID=UPI0021E2249C|nr:butyrophilin-like protein 2 [Labeo rohita]
MVLNLCISASGSTLLLCWLIYCRSPDKGFTTKHSCNMFVPLGGSVVLPCHVDKCLLNQNLMVEWRRVDKVTLVHLYQDGESQAESQQQDYHDRAHFFTDKIQHGNFSLRLDNLRAEDAGQYTCTVYSDQDCVYSAETNLVLRCSVGEFDPLVHL